MPLKRHTALLFIVLAFALSGCSRMPYVHLLNNTGHSIVVMRVRADARSDTYGRVGDWPFGFTNVGDRSGRDVVFRAPGLETVLEIRIARCTFWYAVPPTTAFYGDIDVVQLEPDRVLYFVASNGFGQDVVARPVRTLPEQPEGFPASPMGECL